MAILPGVSDIREFFGIMGYYLGLRKSKPPIGEFDYTEKVEYWAVIWGTIVMGLTGFILWFPELITKIMPSAVIRASELVHYYEAILASLAILIFHLFFVIVHPLQFPMSLSWLNGKMSLKVAVYKHPAWVDNVLKSGDPDNLLPEEIKINCKNVEDVKHYLHENA
jgi:cytochrome b subunit of formate dehydrogenase